MGIDIQTMQSQKDISQKEEPLRVMTKENVYDPRWSKFSPLTVEGVIDDYLEGEFLMPYVHNSPGIVYIGEERDQLRHGFGQLTTWNQFQGLIVMYEGIFLCGAIHLRMLNSTMKKVT